MREVVQKIVHKLLYKDGLGQIIFIFGYQERERKSFLFNSRQLKFCPYICQESIEINLEIWGRKALGTETTVEPEAEYGLKPSN